MRGDGDFTWQVVRMAARGYGGRGDAGPLQSSEEARPWWDAGSKVSASTPRVAQQCRASTGPAAPTVWHATSRGRWTRRGGASHWAVDI